MHDDHEKFEIRACFDEKLIAVYSAFDASIANIAVKQQKLLPPFSYSRMTWIKPSYLWMMYRSEWGNKLGMERILRIWILRSEWDKALKEAILTTPETRVYSDPGKWRSQLERARIRVQWDPERDIHNKRQPYKSIQVGITAELSEVYAKRWIQKIEDCTSLTHQIRNKIWAGDTEGAELLLPSERLYPVGADIARALGMSIG